MKEQKIKERLRLLAAGYLWEKTQGKASQEAMRYFSAGACWAYDVLVGNEDEREREKERDGGEYEIVKNE